MSVRGWFLPRKKDPVRQEVITPELQRAAVEWVREKAAEIREAESFLGYAGFPGHKARQVYPGRRKALLSIGKDFDAAVGNSKNTPPPGLR